MIPGIDAFLDELTGRASGPERLYHAMKSSTAVKAKDPVVRGFELGIEAAAKIAQREGNYEMAIRIRNLKLTKK